MLLVGQQEGHPACKKLEWWGVGMVICLEQGADLHTAQLMPLPLTVSSFCKSRLVFPFWYRLTQVVPDKGPLKGCVQGGQKTRLFFRLDNFVTVSPRKACGMAKFSQFYGEKGTKLAFQ